MYCYRKWGRDKRNRTLKYGYGFDIEDGIMLEKIYKFVFGYNKKNAFMYAIFTIGIL